MNDEKKTQPDAGREPPRGETAEMLAVEAFLRAHDPALVFPEGFDRTRERRLLRYMRHPRLALLLLHHRTASLVGAALAVALVALALYWLVRKPPENPVLAIRILPAPVEAPAAPLEADAPAEDPTDRAEPLPFDDPALSAPLPPDDLTLPDETGDPPPDEVDPSPDEVDSSPDEVDALPSDDTDDPPDIAAIPDAGG